jgi:hypothetical protein
VAVSALTKIAGVSLLVLLLVALVVWKVFDPCFVKRSVRFGPADGLRVTEETFLTHLPRLPWSLGLVPQRYELVTPAYRIVLTTEDNETSVGVGIESAKAGAEDVYLEGRGIIENPNAIDSRYFVRATGATNPLAFAVRDRHGTVLGRHALSYTTPAYSFFCSIEGP